MSNSILFIHFSYNRSACIVGKLSEFHMLVGSDMYQALNFKTLGVSNIMLRKFSTQFWGYIDMTRNVVNRISLLFSIFRIRLGGNGDDSK